MRICDVGKRIILKGEKKGERRTVENNQPELEIAERIYACEEG